MQGRLGGCGAVGLGRWCVGGMQLWGHLLLLGHRLGGMLELFLLGCPVTATSRQ